MPCTNNRGPLEAINSFIEKESAAIDAPRIWVTFVQFDSILSVQPLVFSPSLPRSYTAINNRDIHEDLPPPPT